MYCDVYSIQENLKDVGTACQKVPKQGRDNA